MVLNNVILSNPIVCIVLVIINICLSYCTDIQLNLYSIIRASRNMLSIIVQQDVTIYRLSGAHITVPTVSGIIETVTATCRERDWMGTGSQFPSSHVQDRWQ